jgi:hypothetical protein
MLYEAANRPGEDRPAFEDCMKNHGTGAIGRIDAARVTSV